MIPPARCMEARAVEQLAYRRGACAVARASPHQRIDGHRKYTDLVPLAAIRPVARLEEGVFINALQDHEEDVPNRIYLGDHAIKVSTRRIQQRATVATLEPLPRMHSDDRAFLIWQPCYRQNLHVQANAMYFEGGRGHLRGCPRKAGEPSRLFPLNPSQSSPAFRGRGSKTTTLYRRQGAP